MSVHAVIMAGGSGTRLWPLSRGAKPKQFLKLCGHDETLLQLTARRMRRVAPDVRVVAASIWRGEIEREMSAIGIEGDVCIDEPEPQGTAAAVALAVAVLSRHGAVSSDVVLICPSDHLIADEDAFIAAARDAIDAARVGGIVTFGIKPTRPETGFGYIKAARGTGVLDVERFVEKPDEATARAYVEDGSYWWNGGCFCFRIDAIERAYRAHFPEGAAIMAPEARESARAFAACPRVSIDVAIMERADGIKCVPLDAGWTDVGSWDAVWAASPKDCDGNSSPGAATFGTHGTVVVETTPGKLVCCIDLEDMIVVDTPDALLIAPRSSSQKLSETVKALSRGPSSDKI